MKKKLVLIPSAYNHRAMGDIENFIPFYKDEMEVFVITDEDITGGEKNVNGVCYVNKSTPKAQYLIITADYVIDAGTVSGNTKLNSSQKRISVWHGTPYKSMFVDLGREHMTGAIDYSEGMDLMVSPSKWYTEHFLRGAMLYNGPVLETAISRTDSLFISEEKMSEIRKSLGISGDKKVALYAPTYRTRGDFGLPFSAEKLKSALGDEWEVVVKLHYLNDLVGDEDVIDATDYPSINNLLALADLMITDYSSLMFDYSVLGKPALFFQYDREEYERDRKFMFRLEDYVDEADIFFTEEELYKRAAEVKNVANLEKVRENFYPHQKKDATAELVKKLDLDTTPRQTREIIFLTNDLNQIGGVHAFVTNLAREFKKRFNSKIMMFSMNEFDGNKDKAIVFDEANLIDVKLSRECFPASVRNILSSTDGIVITCQFNSQWNFQKYVGDKRTVLMFHGDTKDIVNRYMYTWHLDKLNNGDIHGFKRLALLTKGNAELLKEHLNDEVKNKTIYIENSVDFSDAHSLYEESGEFVVVSRLDEDKNPFEYIEIFSSPELNPNYRLHIYGDGVLRPEMEKMVADRGLQERIIFHGYESDKEKMFGGKQGVLSTSLSEGFGLTLVEAIKYGIPAYAYDSYTACEDIVTDSVGVRIPTEDKDAFIEALNSPFNMEKFDNAATIEAFSVDTVVAKWKALFDELEDEVEDSKPEIEEAAPKHETKTEAKPKTSKKKKKSLASRVKNKLGKGLRKFKRVVLRQKPKKKPLVSFIIPFYNANDTIEDTIKSIENCGYPEYEIIIVDDGSEQAIHSHVPGHPSVTYICQENSGCGIARNAGMKVANGKYVFFLDADDILVKGGISAMVKLAEKEKLAVVMGKTRRVYVETGKTEIWCKSLYTKTLVNREEYRHLAVDDTLGMGKLHNLKMLRKNGLQFLDGNYEDLDFMMHMYATYDRIGIVKNHVLDWMVRGYGSSITRTPSIENVEARLTHFEKGFEHPNDRLKVYYGRQFLNQQIPASVQGTARYTDEEKKKLFELLKHTTDIVKPYVVERMVVSPSKKLLYRSLVDGDYDKFRELAEGFSEKYFKELELA